MTTAIFSKLVSHAVEGLQQTMERHKTAPLNAREIWDVFSMCLTIGILFRKNDSALMALLQDEVEPRALCAVCEPAVNAARAFLKVQPEVQDLLQYALSGLPSVLDWATKLAEIVEDIEEFLKEYQSVVGIPIRLWDPADEKKLDELCPAQPPGACEAADEIVRAASRRIDKPLHDLFEMDEQSLLDYFERIEVEPPELLGILNELEISPRREGRRSILELAARELSETGRFMRIAGVQQGTSEVRDIHTNGGKRIAEEGDIPDPQAEPSAAGGRARNLPREERL